MNTFANDSSVIATIEPENIKSVLSTDFKSYSLGDNRKRLMTPLLGEGIFTTDGAAWQHSRDMLRPNFVRTQIGDIDMFEPHIQNVIRAIPRDGEMIDLHDVFFSMSLDIASEFLFGESTGMLSEEVDAETEAFVRAFSYCQSVMEGLEGVWGFLSLFVPDRRVKGEIKTVHGNLKFYFPLGIGFESAFRTHVQILTDFVDSLVEKALKNQDKYESSKSQNPDHRYIFLHELCSQTTSKPKIRSELLNILLAGRDTTASLLSNLWFQLSKSPTLWSKLQSEISTLNGSFPSFEELKELKFLRAVLNESLRLHPVVPENGRQAERDTTLPLGGGEDGKAPVVVRKGQLVAYSLWTMHRRKDLFGEDAEVFRPERWLDGEEGKGLRVGWEYLPFNGGPRICIGRRSSLPYFSILLWR